MILPIRIISIGFLLFFIRYACIDHLQPALPTDKLKVVCTTTILADAVKTIGGSRVETTSIMGPGVDPHRYRARESDAHKIKEADLILYHGLHLEGRMAHIFEHAANHMNTAAVSDIIPTRDLLSSDIPGTYDPHIWHNVALWMKVIEYISLILTVNDPESAGYYRDNTNVYLAQLEHLDTIIRSTIDSIPPNKRYLITAHDAFSYFGKRYGIEVISLQGINTQAEVSIADVATLAHHIAYRKIPALFVETSTPKRNSMAVQHAVAAYGWYVAIGQELFSDALGTLDGPASSYGDMMYYNATAIATALRA